MEASQRGKHTEIRGFVRDKVVAVEIALRLGKRIYQLAELPNTNSGGGRRIDAGPGRQPTGGEEENSAKGKTPSHELLLGSSHGFQGFISAGRSGGISHLKKCTLCLLHCI
jgi:hypothetical protein